MACDFMGSIQVGIVFPFPLTIVWFLRQEIGRKNKLLTIAATAIKHQIGKWLRMKHRKDASEDVVHSSASSLLHALCCLPAFLARWKEDEVPPTPHPQNKRRKQTLNLYLGFKCFLTANSVSTIVWKTVNRGQMYLLLYKCITAIWYSLHEMESYFLWKLQDF